MRKIAAVFVTAALVVGVGGVAAPAGASVSTKTSAFCKELKNLDVSVPSGNNLTEKGAAEAAKAFRKLSRKATGKVRQATKTMAKAFQEVADGGKPTDLFTGDYIRAAGTFALASVKCVTSGITLPDNITLPGS